MSKQAKVVTQEVRNQATRTRRLMLRSGAKGKGAELWSCQYWPDSARSVEQMNEWLNDAIERLGVEVDFTEEDAEA